MESPSQTEEINQQFGKYILHRRIGVGGMAEVFLAEMVGPEGFGKLVALKRILPNLTTNKNFVASFISEGRLGGSLSHPNIVQTLELGREGNYYYLAMEYVQGLTLAALLHYCKREKLVLPVGISLEIARQLCDALEYAHTATDPRGTALKIIHRDLKPENILLSHFGVAKITDFGVAKATSNLLLTSIDIKVKGTVAYMSPEQAGCEELDHRSDLYSLGAIVFEMLTLKRLYPDAHGVAGLFKVRGGEIEDRLELLEGLPPTLVTSLTRLLSRDRDKRHFSASAFRSEIMGVAATLPPSTADLRELIRETVGADAPLSATSSPSHNRALSEGSSGSLSLNAPLPPDKESGEESSPSEEAGGSRTPTGEEDSEQAIDALPTTLAPDSGEGRPERTLLSATQDGRPIEKAVPSLTQLERMPVFKSLHIALDQMEGPGAEPVTELHVEATERSPARQGLPPPIAEYRPGNKASPGGAVELKAEHTHPRAGGPEAGLAGRSGPQPTHPQVLPWEAENGSATMPLPGGGEESTQLANAASGYEGHQGGPIFGGAAESTVPLLDGEKKTSKLTMDLTTPYTASRSSAGTAGTAPLPTGSTPAETSSNRAWYFVAGGILLALPILFFIWKMTTPTGAEQLEPSEPDSQVAKNDGNARGISPETGKKAVETTDVAVASNDSYMDKLPEELPPGLENGSSQVDKGHAVGAANSSDHSPDPASRTGAQAAQDRTDSSYKPNTYDKSASNELQGSGKDSSGGSSNSSARDGSSKKGEVSPAHSVDPPSTAAKNRSPTPSRTSKHGTSKRPRHKKAATPPGYLSVNAEPYAVVYLDGKEFRTTPLIKVEVPEGEHSLLFKTEDGKKSKAIKVTIVSGELKKLPPVLFK